MRLGVRSIAIAFSTNDACRARRYGMIKTVGLAGGPASLRSYEYSRLQMIVTTAGTQLEEWPQMRLFHSVRRPDVSSDKPIDCQQMSLVQLTPHDFRACRPRLTSDVSDSGLKTHGR